jgi:hypothetical protein
MARELERVASLPFASPSGFVVVQANSPQARDMLIVAQDQHWQVLDAIEQREGARAEAIMREHSRIAQRNLREAVKTHDLAPDARCAPDPQTQLMVLNHESTKPDLGRRHRAVAARPDPHRARVRDPAPRGRRPCPCAGQPPAPAAVVVGRPQDALVFAGGPSPMASAYRIAVKRLDDGKGGSLAMWQLAQGDRLRVSEPQNHFALAWDAPAYLLAAGGIGVTPLVGMARALAARGAAVRMLYAARSDAELAYADSLRDSLGDALRTCVGERIDFAAEIAALPPAPSCIPVRPRAHVGRRPPRLGGFGPARGRPALRDLWQQRPASRRRLSGCRSRAMRWTSPCPQTAACWMCWKARVCRRCRTAGAANAACAPWTCWRWMARLITAMCT